MYLSNEKYAITMLILYIQCNLYKYRDNITKISIKLVIEAFMDKQYKLKKIV